ncbi:MAG: sigma-70 family RNA polymerase sigma factor [Planctomycetota bacterium]
MKPETVEVLFVRFRAERDARALGVVFDRTVPQLLRVARRLASPGGDAEDLVQATFLKAIEAADSFDAARPLEPWLLGILIHQAQAARYLGRRTVDAARVEASPPAEPDEAVLKEERVDAVRTALGRLPAAYREVVERHLSGERAIEVAACLGRSPGTVRKQLHRALLLMRRFVPQGLAGVLVSLGPTRRALAKVRAEVLKAAGSSAPGSVFGAAGLLQVALLVLVLGGVGVVLVRPWAAGTDAGRKQGGPPGAAVVAQDSSAGARDAEPVRLALETAAGEEAEEIPEALRRVFHGRAVDEGGKPVGDASVELFAHWNPLTTTSQLARQEGSILARGTTATDGTFALVMRGSGCLLDTGSLRIQREWLSTARVRVPVTLRQCVVGDVVLGPTRRIEMTVTDADGAPQEDVMCTLWDMADLDLLFLGRRVPTFKSMIGQLMGPGPGRAVGESRSGADGRIELGLPESGQMPYLLCVRLKEGPGLVFEVSENAHPGTVTLPPSEWLSGVVEDEEGHPLSDVAVTCSGIASSGDLAKLMESFGSLTSGASDAPASVAACLVSSDERGRFKIARPGGERSSLTFLKHGYRTVTESLLESTAPDRVVRMERARAIEVRVVAAEGGAPLLDAGIDALLDAPRPPLHLHLPLGDQEGVSTVPLGGGAFRVSVERAPRPDMGSLLLRVHCRGFAPQTVPIRGGSENSMTVRLERGNRIHGRVVVAGGRPVEGVVVRAQEVALGDPRIVESVSSAADGSFEVINLPEGTFRVGAFAEGCLPFVSDRMELFLDEEVELPIELKAAAAVEGKVVSRSPILVPPFRLWHEQTDSEAFQEWLGGMVFEVMNGGWGQLGPEQDLFTITDREGRFALRTCPEGEHEWIVLREDKLNPPNRSEEGTSVIQAMMDGGGHDSDDMGLARTTVTLKGGATESVVLEVGADLPSSAALTGWVDGRLPGFRYRAEAGDVMATVEESGTFRFDHLEPGTIRVSVTAWQPGLLEEPFEVERSDVKLAPGSSETARLDLPFHAVVRVNARDRDSKKALRNAEFVLSRGKSRQQLAALTPAGVVGGTYRVVAWSPDHALVGQDLNVSAAGTPSEVEIDLPAIDPWQTRLGTQLVDPRGEAIAHATLSLRVGDDGRIASEYSGLKMRIVNGVEDTSQGEPTQARTDSEGVLGSNFLVEPGVYPATLHLRGSATFDFDLDLTRPAKRIVVPVPAYPRVRVLVVDARSNQALDGYKDRVMLVTQSDSGDAGAWENSYESGSEMTLQPGRVLMLVSAEGYRPQVRVITLQMGETQREVSFSLASLDQWPEGHRTQIVDQEGVPLEEILRLSEIDGISTDSVHGGCWWAWIDENGTADLRMIPAARYRVTQGEEITDTWATVEEGPMTKLVIHRGTK